MKSTLGEFWKSKNVTSLWISGHEIAGGKTYLQNLTDEGEYCDLHELIDNGLSIEPAWDLSGRVVENGSWVWDGDADFRDVQGNSYHRMQVFVAEPDLTDDMTEETRDEIIAAVEAADVCCPEQVCDMVLSVARNAGDWKAELAKAKANDADERKALGIEPLTGGVSKVSEYRVISIYMDGALLGSGRLNGNSESGHDILDCGAQFCDDQDESEEIYAMIEGALDSNESRVKVEFSDGTSHSITWSIVEPMT